MIARFLTVLTAAALVASPSLAAVSHPAAALSVAKSVRASTSSQKKNELAGGGLAIAVAAAAVIAGIVIIADDDDSDSN
ncbi:MAG: hypothetical protein PGN16_06320 [Sphingomonas phyllosphaerae]|uniref:hypothetical protein n=1 Tax=Sphingomonas phyllosphaerae TaxID=257003 RepID=UPI002FF9A1D5